MPGMRAAPDARPFVAALLAKARSATALVMLCAALAGLVLALTGVGEGLEGQLQAWRDTLHPRAASGRFALVEIDARSLRELDRWPWPRSLHARAIDALSAAGAATIAFDVDFSARSEPAQDAALARAIARSRSLVVLATFRQAASQRGRGIVENLPLPQLRAHAQLASVNVLTDQDGMVRTYPYGVVTDGVPRPSISAMLANGTGMTGTTFPIDGAIDPATVPRLSFVDVIRGRVPASAIRGRSLLIGATAIEMPDRYPVPGHGVLPGALIQILAAETLIGHSIPVDHGPVLPLLLVIAALPLAVRARNTRRAMAAWGIGSVVLLLPLATEMLRIGTFDVVPAIGALLAGMGVAIATAVLRDARTARLTDLDTGLPNHRAFEQGATASGTAVALRIGNYGAVAGLLGPARAAELIGRVAERLAFGSENPIHRVEESALAWVIACDDADEEAQRIDAAAAMLRAPFQIGDRLVELGIGFGLADLSGAGGVLGRAMMAADRALARGLRYDRYGDDVGREGDWRLGIAAELDRAMAAGEIWVAYQPKLDIRSGQVKGAEALVRWRHPTRGAIPPDHFIPALEENGRVIDLTLYVLERALTDQRGWRAAGLDIGVAVNVSAVLPADPEFLARVGAVLERFPGQAGALTLEVTESATMLDRTQAVAALETLAALGVQLSIDDYGTGQSTLSYLKRLPAREIKIDKGFVLTLETSRADQAMVRSTIELAHELGFRVVAEGVENQPVLDLLSGYGCDIGQGWHIGRPSPNMEFVETMLQRRQAFAAAAADADAGMRAA